MADQENFEDDLFADLYDDNDASKGQAAPAAAPAPQPVAPPSEPSAPESNMNDHHAGGDNQGVDEDDDDDDDVDFNLGGSSNMMQQQQPPPQQQQHQQQAFQQEDMGNSPPPGTVHKASAKEDGKMFIGGLNWETTDESLRDYFSQFGEVVECTVMRDSNTGRSRGFGFLTFKDAKTVNIVMVKEHFLDGKIIDPKRAIPRDEQEKTSKIFVGGVSQETTDQEFRDYFAQFGRVVDATLMMDKDTGRPRGFGFVTFESEAGVDACINVPLEIHGKPIEVKKAQPRGNLREEEEASKRMKFGGKGAGGMDVSQQGQMGGQGGQNGMSPQMMAQYFQRMQQYFAMMQGQMAMSRGMPMNPAMMQNMMQMQQMQQMMGRGGGGGGQQMNPQMMQQMQQMMQQQQQQQQGGGAPQGPGNGGFDNFNQFGGQQPQGGGGGGHQGGFGGRRGGRGGNAYGGGGGGGGGAYAGGQQQQQQQQQQTYEGMYDDTPAGPNAPPANAPTGPRNAGRPGANYRGGGRGGNRGFHPYSR
ncbi:hypothetical protein N3K66_004457 [Trichothecium roseum]|uniref:Uncharacterized protein n=1 Tax=Trichothecium roseum TaxID=47278 RepID=A0ACC0V1C3_9HYPO|nr:hypothetical protein N3K66_004457 [Trichothecium roseum]